MLYEDIRFIVDYEEEYGNLKKLINEHQYDRAIDYLSQWHYHGEHMTDTEKPWGTTDRLFQKDGYTLSWNDYCGYIALYYQFEEEENCSQEYQDDEPEYGYEPIPYSRNGSNGYM